MGLGGATTTKQPTYAPRAYFGGSTAVTQSSSPVKTAALAVPHTPSSQPTAAAAQVTAPQLPQAGSVASQPSSAPPEIKDLQITAATDPRLTNYADQYSSQLNKVQEGKSREADINKQQLDSDMERQIATAKESALASGANWTAEDENRMRSELTRGKYKSMADFELQSQKDTLTGMQQGLDIEKAPFESQLQEQNLSQGTQKLLMDYAINRGGLISEDKKTAVMETGQAIDAYKAFLSMLSGPNLNFSSSYGG